MLCSRLDILAGNWRVFVYVEFAVSTLPLTYSCQLVALRGGEGKQMQDLSPSELTWLLKVCFLKFCNPFPNG